MVNPDIEKSWKSTCRIILGEEIGSLLEYEDYLKRYINIDMKKLKSNFSGKEVSISHGKLFEGNRIISNDETNEYLKKIGSQKLNINEIKDIDSLLEAVSEKAYYAGNVILGNSKIVENSDRCINGTIIHEVQSIHEGCKQIAFARYIRNSEYCYGVTLSGENKFVIHGYEVWRLTRGFEAYRTYTSSDCYYTGNLEGCQNCMFTFNQRNKNYLIGNLQLTRDEYEKIKNKLTQEMLETLKAKKQVPTIIDLLMKSEKNAQENAVKENNRPPKELETAFNQVTEVVLGKKLTGAEDYEKWLTENIGKISSVKSQVSDKPVYIPPLDCILRIKNNVVTMDEALNLGNEQKLTREEIEKLNLENAKKMIEGINTVTPDIAIGDNINVIQTSAYAFAVNIFRSSFAYWLKNSAYSFYPKETEYSFGVASCFFSKFAIRCNDSDNITRGFELDGCSNCSDCYFCHNCEGLSNCMFCFNVKSLRYAIGNIEVGREEYTRIKNVLLKWVVERLEKEKKLELNIYNIGAKNANKQ